MRRLSTTLVLVCLAASAGLAGEAYRPEETQYPFRAQCGMNLIEIGKHLQMFTMARDGVFPSRLSEALAAGSEGVWRCLACPAAKPRIAEGGFHPSYAYVRVVPGGRKVEDGADDIVVFDAEPAHQGGRNVLFSDMKQVDYLPEAKFQELLAEQKDKWSKRGKTLEIIRDDFIPLTDEEALAIGRRGRSFFGSLHFKIVIAIVVAIGVVIVLLVYQSRKRPAAQ